MILVVVASRELAEALKSDEYLSNNDYHFLGVGGAICGMGFERIILDTIELDWATLKWLNESVIVRLNPPKKPELPSLPDFLKNENLSDYLLKAVLESKRRK